MKKPTKGYEVDQKKLNAFLDKISKEANVQFQGEDGEGLVEIAVRDCSRQEQTFGLPVTHTHLLETEEEWRESISRLIVNAGSALDRLTRVFRIYEHNHYVADNKAKFGAELMTLATKLGVTFFFQNDNNFRTAPAFIAPAFKVWKSLKWGNTKELKLSAFNAGDFGEQARTNALAWVIEVVGLLQLTYGSDINCFLVMVSECGIRVYAAVRNDDSVAKGTEK